MKNQSDIINGSKTDKFFLCFLFVISLILLSSGVTRADTEIMVSAPGQQEQVEKVNVSIDELRQEYNTLIEKVETINLKLDAITEKLDESRAVTKDPATEKLDQLIPTSPTSAGINMVTIHYYRPNHDYDGWGLHLWGDALDQGTDWNNPLTWYGADDFGVYAIVPVIAPEQLLKMIIHKGDLRDGLLEKAFIPEDSNEIWLLENDSRIYTTNPGRPLFKIHYQRQDNDYNGWGLHLWGKALASHEVTRWETSHIFEKETAYGRLAEIEIKDPNQLLYFLVHKGSDKDVAEKREFYPRTTREIWLKEGDSTIYVSNPDTNPGNSVIVHFKKPQSWQHPHVYYNFTDNGNNADWNHAPKMTVDSHGWYRYEIPNTRKARVVFRDLSHYWSDIRRVPISGIKHYVASEAWYEGDYLDPHSTTFTGKWTGYAPLEAFAVRPSGYITRDTVVPLTLICGGCEHITARYTLDGTNPETSATATDYRDEDTVTLTTSGESTGTITLRLHARSEHESVNKTYTYQLATENRVQRFAVIGDFGFTGFSPDKYDLRTAAVAKMVDDWRVDFIATVGDNVYNSANSFRDVDQSVGQYYWSYICPYLGEYAPDNYTQCFEKQNRFFPIVGNHDYKTASDETVIGGDNSQNKCGNKADDNLDPYYSFFTSSQLRADIGGRLRNYYMLHKGVQTDNRPLMGLFAINSDCREPDGKDKNSQQATWLREELAASSARFKLVFLHHPPFTSAKKRENPEIRWDFKGMGADIVIAGHAHLYERLRINGVNYLINGLGGNVPRKFKEPKSVHSDSKFRYTWGQGAMLVEIGQDKADFRFIDLNRDTIDRTIIHKEKTTLPCGTVEMYVRSTFNNWTATPMTCNQENKWLLENVEFTKVSDEFPRFKFSPTAGDFDAEYGDGFALQNEIPDGIIDLDGDSIVTEPGTFNITLDFHSGAYTVNGDKPKTDWQRTIVFIYRKTQHGEDMFIRGGIDWDYSHEQRGIDCVDDKWDCAIPIRHLLFSSNDQRRFDTYLDWYGKEDGQGNVEGSPLVWTTNNDQHPYHIGRDGFGYTPLNHWGDHYWLFDVEMDCSKTIDGWFELKSFISNGAGWEKDIDQQNTPYNSRNHFAQCGKLYRFESGSSNFHVEEIPSDINH